MVKKKDSLGLKDEELVASIVNRINRAHGQLGAVVRMIEEGRSCEEVVIQISAASKALNTAAFNLISASLEQCISDGNKNQVEVKEKLQKLFLTLV